MNNYLAPLSTSITRFVLIIAACLFMSSVVADELKEISQMANQGQAAATINRINAYIGVNPKNAQALFIKGIQLAEQGRREEAIKTFVEVTEKFPNLPEPYNNLAVLYADQGQYDKARKALEMAIKTHPSYATAHENLGNIYARMASEAYDKALQIDNGNARAKGKLSLIKDLVDTGNKTTLATKEMKVANPIRSADIKKPEPVVEKPLAEPAKNVNENPHQALTDTLNDWAQAWSNKNLNKYFARYSDNFKPAKGESRETWEKQRRERINKPTQISVELTHVNVALQGHNSAKVRFKQTYRADGGPIRTFKTLIMEKVGDNWLITQEIAGS